MATNLKRRIAGAEWRRPIETDEETGMEGRLGEEERELAKSPIPVRIGRGGTGRRDPLCIE